MFVNFPASRLYFIVSILSLVLSYQTHSYNLKYFEYAPSSISTDGSVTSLKHYTDDGQDVESDLHFVIDHLNVVTLIVKISDFSVSRYVNQASYNRIKFYHLFQRPPPLS